MEVCCHFSHLLHCSGIQDGYAVVASDGPGDYPVITESRAGNDAVGVTVTSGTVAYVTTGGKCKLNCRLNILNCTL